MSHCRASSWGTRLDDVALQGFFLGDQAAYTLVCQGRVVGHVVHAQRGQQFLHARPDIATSDNAHALSFEILVQPLACQPHHG